MHAFVLLHLSRHELNGPMILDSLTLFNSNLYENLRILELSNPTFSLIPSHNHSYKPLELLNILHVSQIVPYF